MNTLLSRPLLRLLAVLAALTLAAAACGSDSTDSSTDTVTEEAPDEPDASDEPDAPDEPAEPDAPDEPAEPDAPDEEMATLEGDLVGLFQMNPAACDGADVSGSYFRMIQPGGSLDAGPFVPNGDSTCADTTYTPLVPGSDGGLVTGTYQAAPDPAFDAVGNGLATAVAQPTTFFAIDFAIATEDDGALPAITATDGALSGDLSAWSAYYANLTFNQGAPKPDGSAPGLTSAVTGTIDPETGAYTLEWSSQIVGGSFNDFTGVWHLEGSFAPSG